MDGGGLSIQKDETRSTLSSMVLFMGGSIYIQGHTVYTVNGKVFDLIQEVGRYNEKKEKRKKEGKGDLKFRDRQIKTTKTERK